MTPRSDTAWPRISVIIPSLNQGRFIEETLQSVIGQQYPALELIVMDGCSTDTTPGVLERHAPHLSHWECTPDRGQSHAINKGLARATGDVWCYLNSDDLLCPGSLARVGEIFRDLDVEWLGGIAAIFDEQGHRGTVTPEPFDSLKDVLTPWTREVEHVFPCSSACFMRRSVYTRLGPFDESYDYSMDMEYYTRAVFAGLKLHRIPDTLSRWRWHAGSKTVRDGHAYRFLEEELRIAAAYSARLPAGDRAALDREIHLHRKSLLVRRAMHKESTKPRTRRLIRLLVEAAQRPSLFWFRPWLGAVKKQFLAS
jgi:glycosyltransferase involved in cell wall biosynthesis